MSDTVNVALWDAAGWGGTTWTSFAIWMAST